MPTIDKEDFLTTNVGLIKKLANKYHFDTPKFSFEDLVQIGNHATIKALNSYDDKHGVKATTYVYKAVDRDIREFVRANKHDIFISNHAQRKLYKEEKAAELEPLEEGEVFVSKGFDPNSMMAIRLDWDTDDSKSYSEILPSGNPPPEQQMLADEQKDILLEEIERLPRDQQKVIMGKYFHGETFVTLGKDLGMSKQAAKQIEQKAFVTLKTRLGPRLDGFIARADGLARRN